ncbi:PspC domain-containing protein [Pasteurellaceae bacterium HPA106]|uniref:PspC domain-containing protein n=1 Tax=Spirabiliibacterium pneumoniae TaxID=221400 RepID=UPI001AADAF14|nr:PspC domain-containing protein [Spirabiliibacterium pneumoniae]MBE2896794.1 PspC domain-containing protein [Spirabiliibacterium pneumoniae]
MLYRYPQQGMISGVCTGIAKASGLEIWVVRAIAVLLFLFGGFFFVPLAYIAGALMLEKAPDHYYEHNAYQRVFQQSPREGGQSSNASIAELEMYIASLKQRVSALECYVKDRDFKQEK